MSAATDADAAVGRQSAPVMAAGVVLVYVGFAAIVVSAIWTAAPFTPHGIFERQMIALVGLVLIGAGAIGRGRFAASTPGKLLCALGAGACIRVAIDPLLENIGSLSESLPQWLSGAYPGLATVGWIVAAIGALIWWLGGGGTGGASPYRGVALVSGVMLIVLTICVRAALTAVGYDVPAYDGWLLVWRIVEAVVVLLVAMSVAGERMFAQWPLILFGIGLLGHIVRTFVSQPPA